MDIYIKIRTYVKGAFETVSEIVNMVQDWDRLRKVVDWEEEDGSPMCFVWSEMVKFFKFFRVSSKFSVAGFFSTFGILKP
jgi:hypothetical protein